MKPKSRALLILGPHRSGTSAFTRVTNILGVDLGKEMLPPKFDNPQGYWEHRQIFELHERLLSRVGSAWHDYRPLPAGWQDRPEVLAIRQELLAILRGEFGSSPLWGVKDPRLCRLVPLWLDLLGEMEIAPAFVILIRHPLEVVDSLVKRDGFSRSKALLLYLIDLLAAIHHTEGHRRVFVSYKRLLQNWQEVVAEIARQLPLEWPRESAVVHAEIDAFLNPSERHHRHSLDDLRAAPGVPGWVTVAYEALEAASRGEESGLGTALQRAQDHLTSAWTLFLPEFNLLMGELARVSAGVAAIEEERSHQRQRHGETAERANAQEHQIAAFKDEVARLAAQVEVLDAERIRADRRVLHAETELMTIQKHLTAILSSPLYRLSRCFRQAWRTVGGTR